MSSEVIVKCDICKSEVDVRKKNIQIIFKTDQTEGRNCKPYLDIIKIDICKECLNKIIKGKALYGAGAQGYNDYWFEGGGESEYLKFIQFFVEDFKNQFKY